MDAAAWDDRYRGNELVWGAGPNQFVREIVEPLTPGRAVDLACGEGRNAIWLAEQGWSVTAADFSAVGLEVGRRIAEQRAVVVDWIVADATAWESTTPVDLVVVAYLQLPPEQLVRALGNAAASLAPGGRLVVVAHHRDNLVDGVGGPQDASVLASEAEVAEVATTAGLVVDRSERAFRAIERPGHAVHAVDLVVVARRPEDETTHTSTRIGADDDAQAPGEERS
jgi:SAM-dependent methyltransferase